MSSDVRDNIERLLDDALASYARPEPRPGLERRVLDRIHADAAPRFAFPRWAWAVPAAACLLWAGFLWTRPAAKPGPVQVVHVAPVLVTAPLQPETPWIAHHARIRKRLPKLPQFPAPVPITQEEQALLAFVTGAPKEVQASLLDAQDRGVEPIRIEEIKIQELQ
jgi:hypothetical protein